MPKQKDFKRLVRARMRKTGESYATAHAQLTRKGGGTAAAQEPTPAPDLAARAGMSDEAVRAKTGRSWAEWVEVLDAEGAAAWPHREIAELVHSSYGLPDWWSQTVTVGYERIKGLREIGQRRSGDWEATKSKTVPVPIAELYRAFSNARTRARWLPEPVTVRSARAEKAMRLLWEDGTPVEVGFYAKSPGKSQVAIQHRKLRSRERVDAMKRLWGERLEALARSLAG